MKARSILFVSCNPAGWGGSEELWARAAAVLARWGHLVRVAKPDIVRRHPRIVELRALGCPVTDLSQVPLLPRRLWLLALRFGRNVSMLNQLLRLWVLLKLHRFDLVVLSQGGNWDGFLYARILQRVGTPYVVVSQKATELYWPSDWMRHRAKALYADARHAYFVSEHNRRLTEEQLGMALPRASVVRNPFLHDWNRVLPWPEDTATLRLACVGRLFPMEKAQDMLIRVLARPKWKARPISVTFYGEGDRIEGLREMAAYLGVDSARFVGFADDVTAIWEAHHALVLPTRAEGLPLVVVEAMLAGRVVITTDVAGNPELCRDGVTGFLARGANEDALDAAMEAAWQRRADWPAIAAEAAREVRTRVPADPAADFAERVLAAAAAPAPALAAPQQAAALPCR